MTIDPQAPPSAPAGVSFRLTDEQRELHALAHEFALRELRPIAAEWDQRDDFPPDLLAKAARAGLTSYAIPREHGGGGVDNLTAALLAEELSWGCAGLAATIQATMFPVRPLVRFGTDEQRERYLPLLASEDGCLAAIAFTEPHAGSDLNAITTSATRDGDAWVLSGEKCYVTNGGIAELTVVFARTGQGITAFLVERGDPGVRAGRKERKLGLRASLHGLAAPRRCSRPRGPAARGRGRGLRRGDGLLRALASSGRRRRRRRRARRVRARRRIRARAPGLRAADPRQAGRLVQARRHGDADRGCPASRLARRRRGRRGEDAGLLGSYAKAFAADAAMAVATDAVQVLGGAGIMADHPVEKWLRDAKVFQIVEGTSEIQRQIVATYLKHGWTQRPRLEGNQGPR